MTDNNRLLRAIMLLLTLIAFVAVVAALRAAQAIVVPFMVAMFVSLAASPSVLWLQRKGAPAWVAVVGIGLVLVAAIGLFGFIAGSSVEDFSRELPAYSKQLREQSDAAIKGLGPRGGELAAALSSTFDSAHAMKLAAGFFHGVGDLLTNAAVIVFILIFMLFEITNLPGKLRRAIPDSQRVLDYNAAVARNVKNYLAVKTCISLATGLTVAIFLAILRIEFAILWGLLAFLLNYIPNIGSILAAIPAVLLALVQYGPTKAVIVGAGYLVINLIFGNLVEPKLEGEKVGLSPLTVFLSLVFWGWVLGPIGMLLSVPLTTTVKLALEGHQDTRWVAVLLGSTPKTESGG